MKIRKLFLATILIPILGAFVSCHNTESNEIAQLPYVNFENNVSQLNFIKGGESKSINLESSRSWVITNIPEWANVSPTSGGGNKKITIAVSPNTGTERSATITVSLVHATNYVVTLKIVQEGTGSTPSGEAIYTEDCGPKVEKTNNLWPYVDAYTGWSKKGNLPQTEVTYSGSGASVRNSGANYDAAGGLTSGAPYVYFSKIADFFQINSINITGNSNLTLKMFALFQSDYSSGPVFSAITEATFKMFASIDGKNWAEIKFVSDNAQGWSLVASEFKVPQGTTKLYIKVSNFIGATNNQLRIDDINIYSGGNGDLINPGGGGDPSTLKKKIYEIRAHKSSGATAPEAGWYIEGIVVSDKDGKNLQSYQIAVADSNILNSGIMINYKKGETNPSFNIGDKVKITLTGTTYSVYNGLLQIANQTADNVTLLSTKNKANPISISANDLKTGNYESMLVSIANTELKDKSDPTKQMSGNIDVVSGGTDFVMRTGGTATFANKPVPTGKGKLVGIAGIYNDIYQVFPRNEGDYADMNSTSTTPSITTNYTAVQVEASGGDKTITITTSPTDLAWKATLISGATVTPTFTPTSGNGNGSVKVTFPANTDATTKTATIKLTATGAADVNVVFTQEKPGTTGRTYITVAQIRSKYTGADATIIEDAWVKATIISNMSGGNSTSKRNIVVQDETAGIAIRLAADNTAFEFGDKVEIHLKDQIISSYNKLVQLNNVPRINIEEKGTETVTPKIITAAQLLRGSFESRYVAVQNVQVIDSDLSKNIGNSTSHTSIGIESSTGEKFDMFTSKYAIFIGDKVPQGSGTLKGLASINNDTHQIIPTVASDYSGMTGARFGGVTPPKLNVNATTVQVEAAGGEKTITITTTPTNLAWTATLASEATVTPTFAPANGSGNGSIKVTFPANTTTNTKTATIKLTATGVEDVNVVFTQAATGSSVTTKTITMTFDDIVNGKTGTVDLGNGTYGSQNVNDETTWYTWTKNGKNFKGVKIAKGTNAYINHIQQQGNGSDASKQGKICNTDGLGKIKSITIVTSNTNASYPPSATLYMGTASFPKTNKIEPTTKSQDTQGALTTFTYTYDTSAGNYSHFNFDNNTTGANYYKSITIKYEE